MLEQVIAEACSTWWQLLAAAVIRHARRDPDGRLWLSRRSGDLDLWCAIAGVDPSMVVAIASRPRGSPLRRQRDTVQYRAQRQRLQQRRDANRARGLTSAGYRRVRPHSIAPPGQPSASG
jgi:hypothetical protein